MVSVHGRRDSTSSLSPGSKARSGGVLSGHQRSSSDSRLVRKAGGGSSGAKGLSGDGADMDEGEEEKIRQIEGYLENMVRHTLSLHMVFGSMGSTEASLRRGSSFGGIAGERQATEITKKW